MSAGGAPYAAFDVEAPAGTAAAASQAAANGDGPGATPPPAASPAAWDTSSPWDDTEHDPLFTADASDLDGGATPSGRSAGGDILAGLRALTYDPLASGVRAAGGAFASAMPQGLKDGAKKGADAFKDGFLTGAGVVKGGFVKTGDLLASAMPQELKDGLKTSAQAAQRGAQYAVDAAAAGAAIAKDVAVESAGVVISVLPQEFKDVAAVSREAVEKLAEAGRAVERLLKDKAWRGYNTGGQKKGKKARRWHEQRGACCACAHALTRTRSRQPRRAAVLQLLPRAPRLRPRVRARGIRGQPARASAAHVLICPPALTAPARSSAASC
jgi:hypothetical protein